MAETREEQTAPEPAVLAKEDRLIALEFKTELDEDEQRVFAWLVVLALKSGYGQTITTGLCLLCPL